MRIQIVTTTGKDPSACPNLPLAAMLSARLGQCEGVSVVDDRADVVHVFGTWSRKGARAVRRYAARRIPVVFTSADGLCSMLRLHRDRRRVVRRIAGDAAAVHVIGPLEGAYVRDVAADAAVCEIANPGITSVLSEEGVVSAMLSLYVRAAELHDRRERQQIAGQVAGLEEKDTVIRDLCAEILYARYQAFRGNLGHGTMDGIAGDLTRRQYDEDRFAGAVRKLGVGDFCRRLLYAAGERASLTEGFMPVPPLEDRQARRLVALIDRESGQADAPDNSQSNNKQ